jgi:hypothetical protein
LSWSADSAWSKGSMGVPAWQITTVEELSQLMEYVRAEGAKRQGLV